jgi:hypothetical protein
MFDFHPAQTKIPPANRQNLSHRVKLKDYGNPDCLHASGKLPVMVAHGQAVEVRSEKANAVL